MPSRSALSGQAEPLWVTPEPSYVPGAWFDKAAVANVVEQFRQLRHFEGRWFDQPFRLEPWQVQYIIRPVFGWKHSDGSRIIRTAWLEVPRKNGKSTLASGLALILLAGDGEPGAQVYAAAASLQQAKIVFRQAKTMAERSLDLRKMVKIQATVIEAKASASVFRAVSSIGDLQHGLNIHGAVIDEVHVHKTRELIDALETGTGSRTQPLVIFITTADEGEQGSIYDEKHEYVVSLAKGLHQDPTTYGAIFGAREDADPFAEETQRSANPGYGVTVMADYLRAEAEKAKAIPGYLPTYKRLALNIRSRPAARAIDLVAWDACGASSHKVFLEAAVRGQRCFAGLDVAAAMDLTAWCLAFPVEYDGARAVRLVWRFWITSKKLAAYRADGHALAQWADQGLVEVTDGDLVDFGAIRRRILEDRETYDIAEVGHRPWQATQLVGELADAGLTTALVQQTFPVMDEPTRELLGLVAAGRFWHNNNPVARWTADNMALAHSGEYVKPEATSRGTITGVRAAVTALERLIRSDQEPSVYETRGLLGAG